MNKKFCSSLFVFFSLLLLLIGSFFPIAAFADTVTVKSATLPSTREGSACAENSSTHKIYCFGGYNGSRFDEIMEYDPPTDTLTVKSHLPTTNYVYSCIEDSNTHKIYCLSGHGSGSFTRDIIEYDPSSNAVTTKSAQFPGSGRGGHACAEDSSTHKIYCFGGHYYNTFYDDVLEYDPATDTLTTKAGVTLPSARRQLGCAENSSTHKIYCFGGYDGSNKLDEIVEYDPSSNSISVKSAHLPVGINALTCVEDSDIHQIFCFGGSTDSGYFDGIIKYDPATDSLAVRPVVLPSGRGEAGCAENSQTHKIYCFGGRTGSSSYIDQIIEYFYALPPSCSLSYSAPVFEGQSPHLSWTTQNAASGSIDNGIGNVTPIESGSVVASPIVSDTTYTMTVDNGSGDTSTCSVLVRIERCKAGLVPCGRTCDVLSTPAYDESKPCTLCSLILMVQLVIEFLVKLSTIVALFAIAAGGLLYMFSSGNQSRMEAAKTGIKYALLGFVVIFIAWAVVATILAMLGYIDPLNGEWYVVNC